MNPRSMLPSAGLPAFSPHFQVEIGREDLLGFGLRNVAGFANLPAGPCKPLEVPDDLLGLAGPDRLCVNFQMIGRG